MTSTNRRSSSRGVVYITAILLLLVIIAFIVAFISATTTPTDPEQSTAEEPTTETVTELVAIGDADRGAELMREYECAVCHIDGADVIAPSYIGLAERAGERKPSMSAAEYIYESIINPTAFLVSEYTGAMPTNYADRLTEQELADMVVYLLSDIRE